VLTRKVIAMALEQATVLRSNGWHIPISVNISASDLLDLSLIDYLAAALAAHDLDGAALRAEITESLLVDGERSAPFLTRLRAMGVEVAVDDYGTGYSSLAYLHDLPVSYLKIDRAFTQRLDDPKTAVIVASTIDMAHRLDFRVVADRGTSAFDAFEHGEREVFGVQFHPEARGDFARSAGIDPAEIDARLIDDGRRLLSAFRTRALARWGQIAGGK